ncbi:hypothetical protein SKAU_G00068640 [Synaphobranchus kaupii]|uniref:Uncharacterized protein n=1 Tax=Synaphobranchus kaupii TaxID=118154 RepID=A0A9Q1G7G4_SYNKA|nr:hypothetical protein SKAU_G00068640 [Synaphobranchus kaupii]
MPPLRTTAKVHSLQSQDGMEWGQSEDGLLPLSAASLLILLVFGLLLLLFARLMEACQQRDAAEPAWSVEETNPHLGPYMPSYD